MRPPNQPPGALEGTATGIVRRRQAKQWDFFVSYHRGDEDFASRLTAELRANGASVWYDLDVNGPCSWIECIDVAIRNSARFVLVDSARAPSHWVRTEMAIADWYRKAGVGPELIVIARPGTAAPHRVPARWYKFTPPDDSSCSFRILVQSLLRTKGSELAQSHEGSGGENETAVSAGRYLRDTHLTKYRLRRRQENVAITADEEYLAACEAASQAWAVKPLDLLGDALHRDHCRIVDMGSGATSLRESVGSTHEVISIDASGAAGTPPRLMADTGIRAGSADLVVFSLSLYGRLARPEVCEAARILHPDGELHIVEPFSRFRLDQPTRLELDAAGLHITEQGRLWAFSHIVARKRGRLSGLREP